MFCLVIGLCKIYAFIRIIFFGRHITYIKYFGLNIFSESWRTKQKLHPIHSTTWTGYSEFHPSVLTLTSDVEQSRSLVLSQSRKCLPFVEPRGLLPCYKPCHCILPWAKWFHDVVHKNVMIFRKVVTVGGFLYHKYFWWFLSSDLRTQY